ncbi:hypothetical protein [Gracilimonas sp.]
MNINIINEELEAEPRQGVAVLSTANRLKNQIPAFAGMTMS